MAVHLTQHFTLDELLTSEIASLNDIVNIPDCAEVYDNLQYIAYLLEIIRKHFGRPIRISSGYRCPDLNKLVGGSEKSNHLQGLAVDIDCGKVLNKKLYLTIHNLRHLLPINELINEKNYSWIHLSFYKL